MILIYLGYMMIVSDPWSESYGLCIKLEIKKLNSPTGAFLYCPFPLFHIFVYLSMASSHFDLTSKPKLQIPISLPCKFIISTSPCSRRYSSC
uniref:Uncharacterized protein n=1 Tax=Picea sitchensis TaxID=3332 RepID=D5A942_PICSI|nr:unknown [Picea sitchensis]